jgi:hypothetical protein
VRSSQSGTYSVPVSGTRFESDLELVVVSEEDIVALDLRTLERASGELSISVLGITEEGRYVLGLDPSVDIGGTPPAHDLGSWLFLAPSPPPAGVRIVARWGELEAEL